MAGGCCALPARTRHAREDDRKAQQSFTQHYTTTPAGLRSESRSKSVRRADRGTAQAAPAYSSGVRRLREHTHAHTPVPSGSQISTRPPRTPARLRFFLTGLVPGNAVSTRPPRGALRLRHRRSGRDGKERPQPCPVCTLERLRVVGSPPAAAPGCVEETAWKTKRFFVSNRCNCFWKHRLPTSAYAGTKYGHVTGAIIFPLRDDKTTGTQASCSSAGRGAGSTRAGRWC